MTLLGKWECDRLKRAKRNSVTIDTVKRAIADGRIEDAKRWADTLGLSEALRIRLGLPPRGSGLRKKIIEPDFIGD